MASRMLRSAVLAAALAFTGCASISDADIDAATTEFLSFLERGRTTRGDAILRLGQPSASFEGDGILTWRVTLDRDSGSPTYRTCIVLSAVPGEIAPWRRPAYSLVLTFDAAGRLEDHNLVEVAP